MKTILAPIDFSEVSGAVVAEAARLARAMEGRVVVLTVVVPPTITADYGAILENISEAMVCAEKAATRRLEQIAEQLRRDVVPVEIVQLSGPAVSQIVEHAQKISADYLVMGSHGHSAVYELLVGSTTYGVLKRAPCPVVIVPPAAAKNK